MNQNLFSDVTKNYLTDFDCILNAMITRMTDAKESESISQTFIAQMIPHHQAAIQMSENLLKYTTCVPLQKIASDIINTQTQSIKDMQDASDTCASLQNTKQELGLYMRRFECITRTMFSGMASACASNDINSDFIREMIPHHRGAIRMSDNALNYPLCPELLPILDSIITSQKKGICQMERLLKEFSCR